MIGTPAFLKLYARLEHCLTGKVSLNRENYLADISLSNSFYNLAV